MSNQTENPTPNNRKVGYAIVGLGKLAVEQVLPAFAETKFCEPVALISGDRQKAQELAANYNIDGEHVYTYDEYDRIVNDPRIEAVYIILPNNLHAEYTIRAFRAGKHVLCEKPMAVTPAECQEMIAASQQTRRKLMIAYRLHYEPFNQKARELCRQGALGKIKTFSSSNSQNVDAPDIRLQRKLGGGPVSDVGIYSINAARYIIGEEPVEVSAFAYSPPDDPRFAEVPESVVYTLRYPSGVLAHCECGFGHARSDRYRVVGDKGWLELDPAFAYSDLQLRQYASEQNERRELPLQGVNHFAAEMDHFAQCILHDQEPMTDGAMGLADVRIIAAIYEAARTGMVVALKQEQ